MKQEKNILWNLYSVFFQVGLFTIGGGYAMLPMLQRHVVEKLKWATDEEIMDYYAIGQSTPGIIAINTATFVGYKKKGIIGGIVATLGMVSPSWIIIIAIAAFFQQFADNTIVQSAFSGIRVVVVVLIINAVIKMKKSVTHWLALIIAVLSFIAIAFLKISPIPIILTAGILGVILNNILLGGKNND